jgi:hypothetical protein
MHLSTLRQKMLCDERWDLESEQELTNLFSRVGAFEDGAAVDEKFKL